MFFFRFDGDPEASNDWGRAMSKIAITAVLMLAALGGACSRRNYSRETEEQRNSAAHKVGKAAYSVAQESESVARKLGRKLGEATRDAHEGWKDAAREHKTKTER